MTFHPSASGLDGARAVLFAEALERATRVWSHPRIACTSVQLSVGSEVSTGVVAEDGANTVVFRFERWCQDGRCGRTSTYPPSAAAMTTTYPPRAEPTQVREADIELNAVHFAWFGSTSGQPEAPLDAVLVHEIGHALGFPDRCGAHVWTRDAACDPSDEESVMNAASRRTELSELDIARLCAAYPLSGAAPPDARDGGRSWVPSVMLIAALAALATTHYTRRRPLR